MVDSKPNELEFLLVVKDQSFYLKSKDRQINVFLNSSYILFIRNTSKIYGYS